MDAERQAALRAAVAQNGAAGQPPYLGVRLLQRGEVLWVLREHGWSGEREASHKPRADLRGIHLEKLDLSGIRLDQADLRGARLDGANLSGARLRGAQLNEALLRGTDLRGAILNGAQLASARLDRAHMAQADLDNAHLSGAVLGNADLRDASADHTDFRNASLGKANLSGIRCDKANFDGARLRGVALVGARMRGATFVGARLWESDFTNADLIGIDLGGAHLRGAHLHGACLRGARMDIATSFGRVLLDSRTQLGDIIWNNVPLIEVDWQQAPRLGDEVLIASATNRQERVAALHQAARAYRGLVVALRAQGIAGAASMYRLREQQLEQRTLRLQGKLFAWLFSRLLEVVAGYGERPGRAFVAYLTVVLGFAGIYWGASNAFAASSLPLKWYEALVLSLSSFHGRGFFPTTLTLGDPLAIIAACEAVMGLFIELIFIATFSRRFLGD